MFMYNFQHSKKRFIEPLEKNSGVSKTETAGYIPAKQRIENMILAGQRLSDYRKQNYDFPDGDIDENFEDPTRSGNFDLSDAFQLARINNKRLKASQASQEQRIEEQKLNEGKPSPEE